MKDIKGYEGKYAITEDGKVWSYISNQFLKPMYKPKTGYERVELQGQSYLIHRLVAEAYIPNPENKPTVDHIDRNVHNNHVSNLRWATYSEQRYNQYKYSREELTYNMKNNGCCSERKIHMCNKDTHNIIQTFNSMTDAAIYLNDIEKRKNISAVCRGKKKSAYGYYWQFAD